jgi:hypothetical protein
VHAGQPDSYFSLLARYLADGGEPPGRVLLDNHAPVLADMTGAGGREGRPGRLVWGVDQV